MPLSVLISDPDDDWAEKVLSFLKKRSLFVEKASDGKDCQLKMYRGKFFAIVLDIETQNHSSIEVLRYIRLSAPAVKVILTAQSSKLKKIGLGSSDLKRLGASDILIKPYSMKTLRESIEGINQFEEADDTPPETQHTEQEIVADDSEFTHVKVEDFYSGNTTIFDCYIRAEENKYIRVAQKGYSFKRKQIDKLINQKKISHLYFKTKERANYINFVNKVLEKIISLDKGKCHQKIRVVKNLTEKYIEETYTEGLKPQLMEEGKKVCQNMFDFIQRDPDLADLMSDYQEHGKDAYTHIFLTSFISVIICKNLNWTGLKIIELAAFGSLLHDIGMLKLSDEIRAKEVSELNREELSLYQSHPRLGAELLQKYPLITEPVRQIVYQHHEYVNGSGFPKGLTGMKIYPLAKVVALGNEFANFLIAKQMPPLQCLSSFIPDKERIEKFDPGIVKALVQGFIKS